MSAVALSTPSMEFITNSFNYVLTEMSSLSVDELKLLASFFELQASKYNSSIFKARIIAVGFFGLGVTLAATAFSINNEDARIAFILAGGISIAFSLIVALGQLFAVVKQKAEMAWHDRCMEFIDLKTLSMTDVRP